MFCLSLSYYLNHNKDKSLDAWLFDQPLKHVGWFRMWSKPHSLKD